MCVWYAMTKAHDKSKVKVVQMWLWKQINRQKPLDQIISAWTLLYCCQLLQVIGWSEPSRKKLWTGVDFIQQSAMYVHMRACVFVLCSGKPWILLIPSKVYKRFITPPSPSRTCGPSPELQVHRNEDLFSISVSFCSLLISEMTHGPGVSLLLFITGNLFKHIHNY